MRVYSLRSALVAASVFVSLASLALLAPSSAHAAPITVNNHSFETPVTLSYTANPALGGWTFETIDSPLNYYVQLLDSTMPAVSGVTDGTQYLGLYTHNSTTRIYQDTGVAWAPNTVYTLSLALGNRDHSQNVGATTHFGLSTDNTVANIVGAASVVNTELIAQQDWDIFTYSITTGSVAPVGNLFIVLTKEGQSGDARIQLDNVSLDASAVPVPAPEPASLALIAGGLVFALRRRKQRS
jgi:hypothetical protein